MTLIQLEYIVALETYRHFVTAAENCYVTQPTLTMQIKKLEQELGVTVFDRKKHPIEPTPIGEKIISKARMILRESAQLKSLISEERNDLQGTFRLGIIPTLAPYILPIFLNSFLDKYPKVNLVVEELQTHQIVNYLQHNLLDLGLLVTPLNNATLKENPILHEPFLAYLSDNHKLSHKESISASDIDTEDLWLLKEGHCFRSQVLNICSKEEETVLKEERFKYESGSIETLKNMVKKGIGYTLVPELALNDEELQSRGRVKRFTNPQPTREISLVTHSSFIKQSLIDAIQSEIHKGLPSHLKNLVSTNIVEI